MTRHQPTGVLKFLMVKLLGAPHLPNS
jgi:hypothetical protein